MRYTYTHPYIHGYTDKNNCVLISISILTVDDFKH